ncbi:23S rRNA (guanosine(2251)-2'-O)-methyltransferase RlmB [Kordiimonas sediminis]|uniref:23S rRNA (guanosine(2251)-2'-O)-methyltransferase RlmB n=1 Tax=Kordiimonas sediminis TaxID=1735581 RepID=UPI001E2EB17B|nr:23S rRNA (guanosine(2251)-2'-O)-methyltransferase RlmB [Kordiimonas sediminis]
MRRPGKNTFKPEGTHRGTSVNAAPNPTTKEPSVTALRPLKADSFFLHGRHAVLAALQNKKRECIRLIGTEKALSDNTLRNARPDIKTQITDGRTIDQSLMSDSPHQGIILEVRPLPALDLNDVEAMHHEAATVLILDQVTDPHNVGACLRSAAALGACAVVTMDKNSPKESGVLARSASGALDSIPWIRVTNLSQALDTLAEFGFWRLGLDGATDKEIGALKMGSKVAIVMGSEGKGLRPLVKKHCDVLGKIPMTGKVESLNVSNAAAIALFQYGTIGSE